MGAFSNTITNTQDSVYEVVTLTRGRPVYFMMQLHATNNLQSLSFYWCYCRCVNIVKR